jgi:hypothetical protein
VKRCRVDGSTNGHYDNVEERMIDKAVRCKYVSSAGIDSVRCPISSDAYVDVVSLPAHMVRVDLPAYMVRVSQGFWNWTFQSGESLRWYSARGADTDTPIVGGDDH